MSMFRFGTVLLCALTVACASTGAVPSPFPRPSAAPAGSAEPSGRSATEEPTGGAGYAIAGTALGLRGVPYKNGGSDPSGFDCSGFIWYVFAQHGIGVPRTVTEQYLGGGKIDDEELQPGDLVFFRTSGRTVSHVGMAIGADQFVHAPSSHGEVRVERLSSRYWSPRYAGARRY